MKHRRADHVPSGEFARTRLHCCVPHCKRSTPRGTWPSSSEWLCSAHWQAIPVDFRRVHGRIKRKHRRNPVDRKVRERIWQRIKRAAIETAAGIT